ncbi:MAG TPA: CPBP family intramembrane glutamic endopeptidase [Anaerolineae bacterium]|nr:CPBP family intramembrane glutamic endopeptidase [Anaerolineae bacterium]
MTKISNIMTNRSTLIAIALFLLMEIPVRLLLQPDPWLLSPNHWYFQQPTRLIIELLLIGLLLIINWRLYPDLLNVARQHFGLMFGAMAGSLLIFSLLELDQLQASLQQPIWVWLLWLFTGMCIGIGQELLYRGLLYTALSEWLRSGMAAVLTTVVFVIAPLHSVRLWQLATQGEWVIVGILIAIYSSVSFFFQWLRDETDSVTVPALAHGVGNAITWVAVFS